MFFFFPKNDLLFTGNIHMEQMIATFCGRNMRRISVYLRLD